MTECLTTIMEFLGNTVLEDYNNFAKMGEQYRMDADAFQHVMQSTAGISGIAEKFGSTQSLVMDGYDKLQECNKSVNVIKDFVAQFNLSK